MKRKTRLEYQRLQDILIRSHRNETENIDRVLSILAQVSLAVLIIFIMIAILFASTYKNEAKYYKDRSEELARTSQKKALVDLQRQKLVLALEQTNHHYRLHLGHLTFYRTDARNRHVVHTENIITGRRIRYDFLKACDFARQELVDVDAFKQKYMKTVVSRAELAPAGVRFQPEFLDVENKAWFENQVREATSALYADTIRLQEDAREGLAKYFQNNLSEIPELQDLADELAISPTSNQITLFIRRVNQFVEKELERQNVKLLKSARKSEE